MRKIFFAILLNIFFTNSIYSEDISDIQIEGISIGESALKYFSKSLLKSSTVKIPRSDNKYSFAPIYDKRFENYINHAKFDYSTYDVIEIYFLTDDKDYKIHALSGALTKNFGKKFKTEKECINLKESIFDEVKEYLGDPKELHMDEPAAVDKTRKSMSYRSGLKINPNSKYYEVEVSCIFYKGKIRNDYESSVGIVIKTDEYQDWLFKQNLFK